MMSWQRTAVALIGFGFATGTMFSPNSPAAIFCVFPNRLVWPIRPRFPPWQVPLSAGRRCRGMQARIVQAAATALRPCGDPRLRGAAAPYARRYPCALRATSASAIGVVSGGVPSVGKWPFWRCRHRNSGGSGRSAVHPPQTLGLVLVKVGLGGKGSHLNADRRFDETDHQSFSARLFPPAASRQRAASLKPETGAPALTPG
jgi:hypothetical protein